MDNFKAGDWVRTKSGYSGKILLASRQAAFIDIEGHDELRASPHLLRELTRVDPPHRASSQNRSHVPG